MADKRATIVISGDVQDVGYRAVIMRIGQKAGLTGYAENLPDSSVKVVCEGEEDIINELIKNVEIHDDDIDVENIEIEWSDATGEFEWFIVKIIDRDIELFQGFATAGRMLKGVRSDIQTMNSDINTRFDTLENRYGEIGKDIKIVKTDMAKLTTELHNSTEALISLTGKIGALIDQKLAE